MLGSSSSYQRVSEGKYRLQVICTSHFIGQVSVEAQMDSGVSPVQSTVHPFCHTSTDLLSTTTHCTPPPPANVC
jgi:hypothetical protein